MQAVKNELCSQEYLYDFAKDGGAISTKVLSNKNGKAPLPVGAILKSVYAKVVTTCTSGGSATVSWGNGDGVTVYSGTAIAVASLTAGAIFNGWDNGASALWDDTNDHPIFVNIDDATTGNFSMAIAADTLTAGKIVFVCEYYLPAIDL